MYLLLLWAAAAAAAAARHGGAMWRRTAPPLPQAARPERAAPVVCTAQQASHEEDQGLLLRYCCARGPKPNRADRSPLNKGRHCRHCNGCGHAARCNRRVAVWSRPLPPVAAAAAAAVLATSTSVRKKQRTNPSHSSTLPALKYTLCLTCSCAWHVTLPLCSIHPAARPPTLPCSMVLRRIDIATLLHRAVAYFSRAAITGDPSSIDVHYIDFSPLTGLVSEATASWASADPELQSRGHAVSMGSGCAKRRRRIVPTSLCDPLTSPSLNLRVTPRRLLLDLACKLAALEGKLAAALAEQRSAAGQNKAMAELLTQMAAALPVLRECAALACVAQLSAQQTAQFASCGVLVVGQISRKVPVQWLRSFAPVLRNPAAAREPPQTAFNVSQVIMQLHAADRLLQLLLKSGIDSDLATFAATIWPPERVIRWLTSVLVVVHAGRDAGGWHRSMVAEPLGPA